MIQTFSAPERSLMKAMSRPSGEKTGCESNAMPLVRGRAGPPRASTAKRSPSSSNTIVLPSGETSGDSHVPSLVSIEMCRVGLSGSD